MFGGAKKLSVVGLQIAILSQLPVVAFCDVCLLLYQLADNDLEYFIRQDNYEISISPFVQTPSLTTWIYFDHRNFKGTEEDIDEPLQNVFQSDGTTVSGPKPTLSQYLRWDHGLGKLVIDRTLEGEQNGDDPATLTQFLVTAMEDCVAKGSTEFFVALSSHGGGFHGFGNDEHIRQRSLTQSNQDIASAMRSALDQVAGGPSMLDVIAFDACLMQAVDAADDYRNVGKFLLASEAIEPGHGWAYDLVTDGDTAIGLARDILFSFLQSKHGLGTHMTPKTLSLIDLAKFDSFLSSWDSLSSELTTLLLAKDQQIYAQMNRARNQAIAFESVVDEVGTNRPSAVDVGSFLSIFFSACVPTRGSRLDILLNSTQNAYNDMFVERGTGEGTPEATGIHIMWPVRREYAAYKAFYDEKLFDTSLPYATAAAPNWLELMKTFYSTPTPANDDTSVCTLGIENVVAAEIGQLLIHPRLSSIQNGGHTLTTEIAPKVDEVFVEFGVVLTQQLTGNRRLYGVLESNSRNAYRTPGISCNSDRQDLDEAITSRAGLDFCRERRSARRSLQQTGQDYFLSFGGNLLGSYEQSSFTAFWDRNFYLFEGPVTVQNFYAFDNGGVSKTSPVIYMPPGNTITSDVINEVPLGMDELEFIQVYGGQIGFLSFTSNGLEGVLNEGLTLFTNDGSSLSETPRSAGGQIIPIQYVEGNINGMAIGVVIGGLTPTVIDWNETFSIRVATADSFLQQLGLEKLVLDVLASDDDILLQTNDVENGVDFVTFEIGLDGSTTLLTYGGAFETSGASTFQRMQIATMGTAVMMAVVATSMIALCSSLF